MRSTPTWPTTEVALDPGQDPDCLRKQRLEALGRLASGVAHDFNNLLTVISGYSQLLLNRIGPQHEMREELLHILRASERAAAFSRQLLYFSSQPHGPAEVLDLNALVEEHARLLRPLIGDDIEVISELASDLPPIEASSGQILQILLNLAANARDAMPHGGQWILATSRGEQAAGSCTGDTPSSDDAGSRTEAPPSLPAVCSPRPPDAVQLTVRDTGCGMDEPTQARIFEPFFTTKPAGRGSGLGLATVAELVKQMGGHVHVSSAPGCGSTFTLSWPAAERLPTPVTVAVNAPTPLPFNETVLVVEDDARVRDILRKVLSLHGYTVLQASSGDQALALVRQHQRPIDLLISDVVMPRMSGQQLATQLKACLPRLRVLFVSGYSASMLERPDCPSWEEPPFLQKPFTPDILIRKIHEVLGKAAAQPQPVWGTARP